MLKIYVHMVLLDGTMAHTSTESVVFLIRCYAKTPVARADVQVARHHPHSPKHPVVTKGCGRQRHPWQCKQMEDFSRFIASQALPTNGLNNLLEQPTICLK